MSVNPAQNTFRRGDGANVAGVSEPADVDAWLDHLLIGNDPVLRTLPESSAAGLPSIAVSPQQGKFLFLIATAMGAKRILEIGTLGGFSTIWLARAVGSDGRVTTLEYEPHHAEVARANLSRARVAERVDVIVGAALETLPGLAAAAPFDMVFIDADKEGYPAYVGWAVELGRPGSLIVADNVVRGGHVLDPPDPRTRGVRDALELMAEDPRLQAAAIQTVGVKGWDGFAVAVVT
jgi:predicted O-methyltransferase YrrM